MHPKMCSNAFKSVYRPLTLLEAFKGVYKLLKPLTPRDARDGPPETPRDSRDRTRLTRPPRRESRDPTRLPILFKANPSNFNQEARTAPFTTGSTNTTIQASVRSPVDPSRSPLPLPIIAFSLETQCSASLSF